MSPRHENLVGGSTPLAPTERKVGARYDSTKHENNSFI